MVAFIGVSASFPGWMLLILGGEQNELLERRRTIQGRLDTHDSLSV